MVIELEREQTQSAEPIQVYLREIGRVPLLTLQQESDLAKRIKRGDHKAREHMIKANLRLVVKIAHDYDGLGLSLLDLISEGNIGLMKAVERFNPKKGAKMSTYASWWIKQAMRRALSKQSRTIRLPVHVTDKMNRLKRLNFSLTDQLGREPTDAELANRCNVPPHKVAQLRTLGLRLTSLDAPIGDGDDNWFGDIIEDEAALTPYELLRIKTMRQESLGPAGCVDARAWSLGGNQLHAVELVRRNHVITDLGKGQASGHGHTRGIIRPGIQV